MVENCLIESDAERNTNTCTDPFENRRLRKQVDNFEKAFLELLTQVQESIL